MSVENRLKLAQVEEKFAEKGILQVLYPIDLLYKKVRKRLIRHLKIHCPEYPRTEARLRKIVEGISWDLCASAGTAIHGIRWLDWNAQIEYYYEKQPTGVRFSRIDRMINDRLIHWHLRSYQDSRATGILL